MKKVFVVQVKGYIFGVFECEELMSKATSAYVDCPDNTVQWSDVLVTEVAVNLPTLL